LRPGCGLDVRTKAEGFTSDGVRATDPDRAIANTTAGDLRAYTTGQLALERFAVEHKRITAEVAQVEEELAGQDTKLERAKTLVAVATKLADDLHVGYLLATPIVRRRYNHAFFEAVFVQDRKIARIERSEAFHGEIGALPMARTADSAKHR